MAKIDILALEDEGMVGSIAGQKALLYGSNNCGKTFTAAHMPKPLLLMTEAGGNAVKCKKTPVTTWAMFKDIVSQLTNEKTLEETKAVYTTIVVDTVERLVELAEEAVCKEFGVRDLSEITGKQNGYNIARKDFRNQINKLCSCGYFVLFVGHEEIIDKTEELTGETYKFTQPKGTDNIKSSARFVRDMCDFTIYAKPNGIDANGDVIPSTGVCKQTKHVFARSRYAIQTFIEPLSAKNLEDAIVKAIERSAEDEGSTLSTWKKTYEDTTRDEWIEMIKPYATAIGKRYPDKVREIIYSWLGEGAKLADATEDNRVELENIYNALSTFACDFGIVVE